MTAESGRRIKVCINCRSRKKKCDKGLPCGYCIKAELRCSYRAVSYPTPQRSSTASEDVSPSRPSGSIPISSEITRSLGFGSILTEPASSDTSLYLQVNRLIRSTGQFVDDISAHYFKTFHQFTPIIARTRFHGDLITLGAAPAADLSLLLLSMALVTPDPDRKGADSAGARFPREMYLSAKSIFSQLQAIIDPSAYLVQATLLLAVHEYIQGQPDRALATVTNSGRLAYAAGVYSHAHQTESGDATGDSHLSAVEAVNIWWGLAGWERIIMWEASVQGQPLVTTVSSNCAAPIGPELLDQGDLAYLDTIPRTLVSSSYDTVACGFGSFASAIVLIDGIFQDLSTPDKQLRMQRLHSRGAELKTFLAVMTRRTQSGKPGADCLTTAVAIRSLFELQGCLAKLYAENPQYDESETPGNIVEQCAATLRTSITIVLDIAEWQANLPLHDIVPSPSFVYIIRATLRNLEHTVVSEDEGWLSRSSEVLRRSVARYQQVWGSSIFSTFLEVDT